MDAETTAFVSCGYPLGGRSHARAELMVVTDTALTDLEHRRSARIASAHRVAA